MVIVEIVVVIVTRIARIHNLVAVTLEIVVVKVVIVHVKLSVIVIINVVVKR